MHRRIQPFRAKRLASLFLAALLPACILAPRGTKDERARLASIGEAYEPPIEKRQVPDLAADADWRAILQRAFLANAELEAAFFEWKAAVARIDSASAWPNTDLSLDFEHAFSGDVKGWDRNTFRLGFDPMQNLSLPSKVKKAGEIALSDARAAGERFRSAKFDLQRRVLGAWLDYTLSAEKLRIQRESVALLKLRSDAASRALQAGGAQLDLLRIQVEANLAEDALRNTEAQVPETLARLNALLAREASARLDPPASLPAARPLLADDARLIALAAETDPELGALARAVEGRRDALELARLAYLPDINPFAGFTGSLEQFIGASITIPENRARISALVEEARAMLRRSEASLRAARSDHASSFVAALLALRNSERETQFLETRVMPLAQRLGASSDTAYAAGSMRVLEWIDSRATLLDVRLSIAEARIAREKSLADLEALAGVDFETLSTTEAQPHE